MRRHVATLAALVAAALAIPRTAAATVLQIPAVAGVNIQPFGAYETSRGAVVVTAPVAFTVPVTIPPDARLLAAVAVPDRIWTADVTTTAAPVRFRVVFESEGAAPIPLYERTIDIAGRPADRRWFDFGRDLTALAGRSGTLRFETTLARDGAPGTLALWAPPELAACGASGDASRARAKTAPSLLLITIDALRADHLSGAGYPRPTTPYLDRFAGDGTRFAAAFAAGPKTIPSIPQILTGTHFFHHRATRGLAPLLVGETAGGSGAARFERSRAVVNNPWVASWLDGEKPGFDTVVAGNLDARAITSAALRWLSAAGRCRTALYLHYLDTHTPYHAPARWARRFIDRNAKTSVGLTFDDVTGAWQGRYTGADRQRIVDLYDGSIAWTDRQLGRLLRGLARRGLDDRTIVVISADHGEELWDHGHFFHGQSLYDELLHVPLLMRIPGGVRGRVVEEIVSSVDLVPTIVDAAGAAGAATDGATLVPLLRATGAEPPHALVFATVSNAEPRAPARQSARSAMMKVIHNVEDGRYEAYDLAQDPRELRNLGAAAPGAADLIAALDAFRHRLDGRGMQLRVRSAGDRPVRYGIQLRTDPPAPIVDPDRVTLERDDHMSVGERSSALTVSGALPPGDEDQVRMDVLAATGTLRVVITIDGAPAPVGTLRIGAGEKIVADAVDLADPALADAPANATPSPGAAPVTVSLWQATPPAETAPAIDPAARERLRALGYAE